MIPAQNLAGVLPPFLPEIGPTKQNAMSPYKASLMELAQKYASNTARIEILHGLLKYRDELRKVGIISGFQWIDGSFVEDAEKIKGKPPGDIDVVTFADRPAGILAPQWQQLVNARGDLFQPALSKTMYKCDAYFIDTTLPPLYLISSARFWFGLFSHQRETFVWKGLIEVSMIDDDSAVKKFLDKGGNNYAS